jgi:hypothetical protein
MAAQLASACEVRLIYSGNESRVLARENVGVIAGHLGSFAKPCASVVQVEFSIPAGISFELAARITVFGRHLFLFGPRKEIIEVQLLLAYFPLLAAGNTPRRELSPGGATLACMAGSTEKC